MRKEIETRLAISATDNYGLSEIIGPGVAGECPYKCGMHISEDAFIPEIIRSGNLSGAASRQRGRTRSDIDLQRGIPDDPLPDA